MNTAQRINRLKENCNLNNYLEIGVRHGFTFNQLDFKYKVAVDPFLSFDYINLSSDNAVFDLKTSDMFFMQDKSQTQFDIIFIDGLHEYKQTYRDFVNCLQRSHDKTIIIIDDVYPSDVFSALTNQSKAVKYRKLTTGSDSTAWHGDVYKTICLIHDLHPLMDFKTIVKGEGNSQTFVYKKTRESFQPKFNSLEQIDRLDYFSFVNDNSFMNFASEETVLSDMISFLTNNHP